MLAIEVNFLTGRFVATAYNDRQAGEWPPHPARLYSALVATWAESGQDVAEREALEWLEDQSAPELSIPEAIRRKVVSHFVPVNDAEIISRRSDTLKNLNDLNDLNEQYEEELESSGGELTKIAEGVLAKIDKILDVGEQVSNVIGTPIESAVELFPAGLLSPKFVVDVGKKGKRKWISGRGKQERHFPSFTLEEPVVTFVWSQAHPPDATKTALDGLLERVTRLGHSSSLVSCRLIDDPPVPNYVAGSGNLVLRCAAPGQLAALQQRFEQHQAVKPRSLPFTAVRYREAAEVPSDGELLLRPDTAGEWIVFEFLVQSRHIPSFRVVEIASTMRAAVMAHAQDPIPEGLSGHQATGAPSRLPHVAFLPLPYVEHKYADSRIMGVAVSLPESLDEQSRRATLRAIGLWERNEREAGADSLALTFGGKGVLRLVRMPGPSDLATLRPGSWHRASRRWTTATPIALPTHPGPLAKGTAASRSKAWGRAEQAVRRACENVGLPEPVGVEVSLQPLLRGVSPAADFPAFRQRGRDGTQMARRLVHAAITFDDLVQGPLVLGAGRFIGLGLMRPLSGPASPASPTEGSNG